MQNDATRNILLCLILVFPQHGFNHKVFSIELSQLGLSQADVKFLDGWDLAWVSWRRFLVLYFD